MKLDDAIRTLKLSYTYDIIKVDKDKKEKRILVGTMAAEMLEGVRDQIIEAAFIRWNQARQEREKEDASS